MDEHRPAVSDESTQLAACEAVVERGPQTFYEVGTALLDIRDARLYRATHGTFEEYCRERWNISKAYAHRMIAAAEVVGNLSPIGDKAASESQIRPLAGLDPEDQRTVWEQAVEESGGEQPTAARVEDVKVTLLSAVKELRRRYEETGELPKSTATLVAMARDAKQQDENEPPLPSPGEARRMAIASGAHTLDRTGVYQPPMSVVEQRAWRSDLDSTSILSEFLHQNSPREDPAELAEAELIRRNHWITRYSAEKFDEAIEWLKKVRSELWVDDKSDG
jgi:hypothetical protein